MKVTLKQADADWLKDKWKQRTR